MNNNINYFKSNIYNYSIRNINDFSIKIKSNEDRINLIEDEITQLPTNTNIENLQEQINVIDMSIDALVLEDENLQTQITTINNTLPTLSTIAYVDQEINNILGGASGAYDTLLEIENELQNNDGAINAILTEIGTKASITYVNNSIATLNTTLQNGITTNSNNIIINTNSINNLITSKADKIYVDEQDADLQTQINTNTNNIATNTNNIATTVTNIATNATNISNLGTRITTAETDITDLDLRITTAETDIINLENNKIGNLSVGSVSSLAFGNNPQVSINNTNPTNPIIDFVLITGQRGATGNTGPAGPFGPKGDKGDDGDATAATISAGVAAGSAAAAAVSAGVAATAASASAASATAAAASAAIGTGQIALLEPRIVTLETQTALLDADMDIQQQKTLAMTNTAGSTIFSNILEGSALVSNSTIYAPTNITCLGNVLTSNITSVTEININAPEISLNAGIINLNGFVSAGFRVTSGGYFNQF